MRTKTILNFWVAAMIGCFATMGMLTACASFENDNAITPQQSEYFVTLFGSDDAVTVTMDEFTALAGKIYCDVDWLDVELLDELDVNGHPVVSISLADGIDDLDIDDDDALGARAATRGKAEQYIGKITFEDGGKTATINVKREELTSGDDDKFIKEWWNMSTAPMAFDGEKGKKSLATPWTVEGGIHIPDVIRKQVSPYQWEMAFSYINDPSLEKAFYFGLYNKYTGQMRIYFYVDDPTGWGDKMIMNTRFGSSSSTDMYPFYHMFEYGIPSNHVLTNRSGKIMSSQDQTFQSWYSPYLKGKTLNRGWYCFEYDMSGYVPKGKDWLKADQNDPRFSFIPETSNTLNVSLSGTITGDIKGTFREQEIVQHGGANATSGLVSGIGDFISGLAGDDDDDVSSDMGFANILNNGPAAANPVAMAASFGCQAVGGIFKLVGESLEDPITYDTIPGKIDLNLNAKEKIDGYISGSTPNGLSSLGVSPKVISRVNGSNGHVGKGVWGLADDPIIYIDKEDYLSTNGRFNLGINSDGGVTTTSFADYNVRMVYALDPTSVKVNINEDVFPGLKDVKVTTNVAVITSHTYGHTDPYRKLMSLSRPSFSINLKGEKSGMITLDERSMPELTVVGLDDLADGKFETASNCKMFAYQKNGKDWQRFYGRIVDAGGKQVMVDPQIFVPYEMDGDKCKTIGNVETPDFLVRVDIAFKAKDPEGNYRLFHFGKLFVPQIKLVGQSEMTKVGNALKSFCDKCKKKEPITKLASNNAIDVWYPGGDIYMRKTLLVLDKAGLVE